ncbi:MAG: hypothetical protein AAFW68_11285 [Pseudomonadota bacterium]
MEDTTRTDESVTERVQKLIDLTASLSRIFDQENLALSEKRPGDMGPLQAEKARLAAAYAQCIRTIETGRAALCGVDSELLFELRTQTADFEARAARQRKLLAIP